MLPKRFVICIRSEGQSEERKGKNREEFVEGRLHFCCILQGRYVDNGVEKHETGSHEAALHQSGAV